MILNCDMCGGKIENERCKCGIWKSAEGMQNDLFKKSLEQFNEMKKFTLTGDAPHLGSAFVFFRGDYNDCKKIEQFICMMKKRPFYE